MENLINFFNKYRIIIICIVVFIVILFIYLIYMNMDKNLDNNNVNVNNTENKKKVNFNSQIEIIDDKNQKLMIFYAPWCKYCKNFMEGAESIWNILKQKHKNWLFEEINCDEENELATKYQIVEFPTIIKLKNNKLEKFDGNRNIEELEIFLNN